jgi:hypothetical protein
MPVRSLARRPTVLIVLHQEHSSPGRVGAALKAMGSRLDIRRPSCGEPLPATLADHGGVVVFGGPMGANDTLEWVRREIDSLETPLAEDKPLLGLCPGAQMLARALGARVFSYDDKRSEIGLLSGRADALGRAAVLDPVSTHCLRVAFRRLRSGRWERTPRCWRRKFPQSGLSLWPACDQPMVPPGGDLSHDVPVNLSRGRAPDPARRTHACGASRRLGLVAAWRSCRPGSKAWPSPRRKRAKLAGTNLNRAARLR